MRVGMGWSIYLSCFSLFCLSAVFERKAGGFFFFWGERRREGERDVRCSAMGAISLRRLHLP